MNNLNNGNFSNLIPIKNNLKKAITGEWTNITITRKSDITTLHCEEYVDGVLFISVSKFDKMGLLSKSITRADTVKG